MKTGEQTACMTPLGYIIDFGTKECLEIQKRLDTLGPRPLSSFVETNMYLPTKPTRTDRSDVRALAFIRGILN